MRREEIKTEGAVKAVELKLHSLKNCSMKVFVEQFCDVRQEKNQ